MPNTKGFDVSLSVFGAGLIHAWLWCVFYSVLVFPFSEVHVGHSGLIVVLWISSQIFMNLFICIFQRAIDDQSFQKKLVGLLSVTGCLGTLLLSLSFRQQVIEPMVLASIGAVLCGICKPMLVVSWTQSFTHMDFQNVQGATALFIALGAASVLITNMLPTYIALSVVVLLPFISFLLLQTKDAKTPPIKPVRSSKKKLPYPYTLFLSLILFSTANSLIRGLGLTLIGGGINLGVQLLFTGIIVIGIVVAFVKSPGIVYSCAILMIAGGLQILSFFEAGIGATLIAVGFICFEVLVWVVNVETIKRRQASASFIVAMTWLLMGCGALIGYVSGYLIVILDDPSSLWRTTVSLALAYGILVVLALSINKNFLSLFKPAPDQKQPSALIKQKVDSLAAECSLTKREVEVATILVSGRSAKHIEKTLFISPNTVKSHIKSIYRKAEVNSREELIDKVLQREVVE